MTTTSGVLLSLPSPETEDPNCWVAVMPDEIPDNVAARLAESAVAMAREMVPRVTGASARRLRAVWGKRWYGIHDVSGNLRYGNRGTRPRVMRELENKTVPMWITDDDGSMTEKVPMHKRGEMTRVTEDGRRQVKIFRKAAPIGSRKTVTRNGRQVSVPRSYPGAPGRINRRDDIGKIAGGNVGVRWRHPGIQGRDYVGDAILYVADSVGIRVSPQMAVVSRHTVN